MTLTVKKLTLMAVLTASALIIFIIEAQIPLPVPVPGMKLGLANAITLFALFFGANKPAEKNTPTATGDTPTATGDTPTAIEDPPAATGDIPPTVKEPPTASEDIPVAAKEVLTTANAFMVLLCRIVLGAVFTGRIVAFIYSITGGLLGFAAQAVMKRFVTEKQIWVCGAVGAVFHNVGQILAAVFITGTPAIIAYLPVLIITGVITGVFTGLIAQLTLERIK